MKQLLLDIKPKTRPTIANFVVGKNAEALHSLQMAITGNQNSRFVYIWGPSGSGKSHLLKACSDLFEVPGVSLHCIDDVHLLDSQSQINLFNLYNETRDNNSVLITSGIAAPSQMGLREDLSTRLAWGLTYQLHPLTDTEKAIALKNHALERSMKLPDDVIDYCLKHLRRDLPTLMAILDALDDWSLTEKKPINVPMLRKLLQLPLNI